jgi:hypothetical protein
MAPEPQSANDHDAATSDVTRPVLAAIAQGLGAHRDKSVVVGGSVPWLQLSPEDMIHVGELDIDLSRDAEASRGREYKARVEALTGAGYAQAENTNACRLARQVQTSKGGPSVDIIDNVLPPEDAVITKNNPPLRSALAVNRRQRVTPGHLAVSTRWHADRRPDPTPVHTTGSFSAIARLFRAAPAARPT